MIKGLFILFFCIHFMSFEVNAQESKTQKKNVLFIGISAYYFKEPGDLKTSNSKWILPNLSYERYFKNKAKLSFSLKEYYYNYYPVTNIGDFVHREVQFITIEYGKNLVEFGDFTVFANAGVAGRYFGEDWIGTIFDNGHIILGSAEGLGFGLSTRIDLQYVLAERVNFNPHIDFQYYFDGNSPLFFMGFNVGYMFGK